MPKTPNKTQQFNMRLDAETIKALKKLAKATERSQAAVVRWLIKREVRALFPLDPEGADHIKAMGDEE